MDEYIQTCLVDILNACEEVEGFFAGRPKRFDDFCANTMLIRAVERNVEIMGEALNRIRKYDADFVVPESRAIIETRNRVIHGYDSVTTDFLWSLVIRHIPNLLADVKALLQK
jgi:uncharacterized protein with HEPN domain